MKKIFFIVAFFWFVVPLTAFTQSPALDPNYVTLQPKETFKGIRTAQEVGRVIDNVGIMSSTSVYGDVFINSLDTLGYGSDVGSKQPLGLFAGGLGFSLFNRSRFILEGIGYCQKSFFRGKDKPPDLLSGNYWIPSHGWLQFDASNDHYVLTTVPDSADYAGIAMHENTLSKPLLNSKRSYDDIIAIGEKILTSTGRIYMEYYTGKSNPYHGEKFGVDSFKVVSASKEWLLRYPAKNCFTEDIDRDNVSDIIFLTENNFIGIAFGKIDNDSLWEVDTILYYPLPYSAQSMLLMDFLWSDGSSDLLLSSNDTIYCYSGAAKNFLRLAPDWLHADLAIPSPAILDPRNFDRNGNGGLDGWGKQLFDAGNINGTGEHSLATYSLYYPQSGSLNAVDYCFIYSGGKAADEKADAIFADNSSPVYEELTSFDTIQTSSDGIMDMLMGDGSYTAGGSGIVYHFQGNVNIPHRADPRWSKFVINRNSQLQPIILLTSNPAKDIVTVMLQSDGWTDGTLIVRDLLGRSVYEQRFFASGEEIQREKLNLVGLPSGMYVIEFSSNFITVSTKCILFH